MQPEKVLAAIHRVWPKGTIPVCLPRSLPSGYMVPRTLGTRETGVNVEAWDDGFRSPPGYWFCLSNGTDQILIGMNVIADFEDTGLLETGISIGESQFEPPAGEAFLVA